MRNGSVRGSGNGPRPDRTVFSETTGTKRQKGGPEKQPPRGSEEKQRNILCGSGGGRAGERLYPENGPGGNISPENMELLLCGQYAGNGVPPPLRHGTPREESRRLLNKMRRKNRETGKQNDEEQRCANRRAFSCSDQPGHSAILL